MKLFENPQGKSFNDLFIQQPEEFNRDTPKELLKYSLGGTLYIPSIRENLFEDIQKVAKNSTPLCR